MKITITFINVKEATAFANRFKEENLRATRVSQPKAPPKEGELGMADLMPYVTLMVGSGFAAGVVKSVSDYFIEKKKSEVDELRIASEERMKMAELQKDLFLDKERLRQAKEKNEREFELKKKELEQASNAAEISFEEDGKKRSYKGDKTNTKAMLEIVSELNNS